MSSTYSTNLAIELIGTGDQAGTWGTTTNSNLGTLIEQSISGYVTQAVSTGTDTTITIPNGSSGVARNMYIELTGTGGASTNLIVPANKKLYFIFNNSSGAVTVKVTGQTGVSVPTGKKMVLVSNGTDIVNGLNYIADFASNSATITHLSATSATITNLTLTSLVISNLSIASANITTLTSASATITNLLATSLAVSSIATFAAGSAAAPSITTTGDTNTGLFFPAADTIAFTEGGVESMRIDSSANVGIGTTSPVTKLQLGGATDKTIRIDSSNGNAGFYGVYQNSTIVSANRNPSTGAITDATKAAASFTLLSNVSDAFITFATTATNNTEPTERLRLDSSGNLGIGTASPASKLDVTGAFGTSTTALTVSNSSAASASNIARIDFRTSNTFGGNERVAAVWGMNPNASANNGGALVFGVSANGTATTPSEVARFDQAGNLGLGVTPSAWNTGGRAIEVGKLGNAVYSTAANTRYDTSNAFLNSSGDFKYAANGNATSYVQFNGTHAWNTAASGTAGNTISFTQAMTLDASGNLGVGTTSPTFASGSGLEIQRESANATLRVDRGTTGDSALEVRAESSQTAVWTTSNTPMLFGTNNTERVRIMSDGAIGVNRTNPNAYGQFAVRWDPTATSVNNGVGISVDVANNTTNAVFAQWVNENGSGIGSVTRVAQTNAVAYNTSSDRRLKNNIAPADDAGAVIDAIEIVKHDWKEGGSVRYGVVAQDLYVIAPEAVSPGEPDGVEQPKRPWGVDYSKLVPMMMKELQSLRKRVAELESK